MAGIQFFGVDEVVEAYEEYAIDCWAICEGKDLIRTGDDGEVLRACLTRLQKHGSAATYTLRVYRNVDDATVITPKTEYSACFKFKLTEGGSVSGVTRYGGVDPLTARLQGVVAEEVGKVLDRKLGRDDDDDKPASFMDGLIGLVNQPDKLIETIRGLQGMFVPRDITGSSALPYAGVSGNQPPRRTGAPAAEPAGVSGLSEDQEEQMERIAAILDRLEKADPNILEHLDLLANLAEKQPAVYSMAIAQLKSLSK
jgi:hypothetical protein